MIIEDPQGERDRRRTADRDLRQRRARRQRGALAGIAVAAVAAAVILATGSGGGGRRHGALVAGPARAATRRTHRTRAGRERAHAALLAASIRTTLERTAYIARGSRRKDDVALTFDDGPGPATPRLLAVLRALHVPATFFVVGKLARAAPRILRQEVKQGDVVGDHTFDHAALGRLPPAAQQREIEMGAAAIRAAGVPSPLLFRPPYGSFDAQTLSILARDRMLMVLWTVDTKDFARPGVRQIAYTALSGARGGAIILMHDGGGDRSETIAAIPRIVRRLRARGFHLVSVPQLVHDDPPPRAQAPPRSLSGG